jgi:hypothetical protein
LRSVFGFERFRVGQEAVCRAAIEGRDLLLVMPTGAGKSLCYQLPAIARGGTAVVISPLIALMEDQAAKLAALGLRVARVHSGLERTVARQACADYLNGSLQFLFIAPERLRVPGFVEMLAKRKLALIAIDEAHCISQWGHDFRPDYRMLGQYLPMLRAGAQDGCDATPVLHPTDHPEGTRPSAGTPISGEHTLVEIGGKDTVEAFSTALRGAKAGQELKAEVIYPADYAEPKLAGKTVAYDVEVKAIKKRTLPVLDDDFAKELGAYESVADLEARIREHMGNRKRRSVEGETKDRLMAALTERFPFPVPESLVQEQIDTRLERGLRALAAQGMEPEQMRKLDFTRLRAAQRDGAAAEVRANILLDRIAAEEQISVTDEELDQELQLAALQSREPIDALKVRLTQDGGLARIREQMGREKTASTLYERLPG